MFCQLNMSVTPAFVYLKFALIVENNGIVFRWRKLGGKLSGKLGGKLGGKLSCNSHLPRRKVAIITQSRNVINSHVVIDIYYEKEMANISLSKILTSSHIVPYIYYEKRVLKAGLNHGVCHVLLRIY